MGKDHARNGVHFFAVAALLCGVCSAMYAEPSKFAEPIAFYGAQVVGFESLAGGLESSSYRFELALMKTDETGPATAYALETISGNGIGVSYRKGTMVWEHSLNQPKPNYIYVSLLLELKSQFEYQKGMFLELILVDENDHQYHYRGFPCTKSDQGEGWLSFPDYGNTPGQTLMVLSSEEYPKTISIIFEVPIESHTITLRFKDQERILFTSIE